MRPHAYQGIAASIAALCTLAPTCNPAPPPTDSFVDWESPPVHGLDLTPDGTRLLATNTADARIEVFSTAAAGAPSRVASIPVGLDPVSVRARTNTEAWVVNHVSDSVSVVDLITANVVATLPTGDEPADVVFAGIPQRAFVSVARENEILVYDPGNLSVPPLHVPIEGEDPRSLATDGSRVYAAVFESGNRTTFVPEAAVSDPGGPYGGQNPPPNAGASFEPPLTPGLPPAPAAVLIVRRNDAGRWLDVNGADWSAFIPWDLHDHDVAVIDAASPTQVGYVTGLMNMDMSVAVGTDGRVAVVGTDATNLVRFEKNLSGTFSRVVLATFGPGGSSPAVLDLNPHLTYSAPTIPASERAKSVADPRSVVWSTAGDRLYVTGMGSNNVAVLSPNGTRLATVKVGSGPMALALDDTRDRLYVLNRFSASVSVIDTTMLVQAGAVSFYDPTPAVIKEGRPLLYDASRSGLGQAACASCHVDARMDQIAWDLGDPSGTMKAFNADCAPDVVGLCEDWHPVKGPLMTQTLINIIGTGALHWRGDREDLAAFAPAFVSLMGAETQPSATEMQSFESFLAATRFPPNPYRNLDNSLRTAPLATGGVPSVGEHLFDFEDRIVFGFFTCSHCHQGPTGTSGQTVPRTGPPSPTFKIQSLRSVYQKDGFSKSSTHNNRGFGITADGTQGSVFQGLADLGFSFPPGEQGVQERLDVEAYLLSFGTDTHAAVGQQLTLTATNRFEPTVQARLSQLIAVVESAAPDEIGLVVKGRIGGVPRGGYYLNNGSFQLDQALSTATTTNLIAGISTGNELTATVVPYKSRIRIGVDRDEDGKLDRDEVLAGTDPANPAS